MQLKPMTYLTIEVEIDHGRVVAKAPSKLPDKARGLLTIIQSDSVKPAPLSQLEAFDALEAHLQLDAKKAAEWMATVHDARR